MSQQDRPIELTHHGDRYVLGVIRHTPAGPVRTLLATAAQQPICTLVGLTTANGITLRADDEDTPSTQLFGQLLQPALHDLSVLRQHLAHSPGPAASSPARAARRAAHLSYVYSLTDPAARAVAGALLVSGFTGPFDDFVAAVIGSTTAAGAV